MPSARPTASAVARVSPVSMTMATPSARRRVERLAGRRLDRIGHAHQTRRPGDRGRPGRPSARRCPASPRARSPTRRSLDRQARPSAGRCRPRPPPLDQADDAPPGDRAEVVHRRDRQTARLARRRRSPPPADARSRARAQPPAQDLVVSDSVAASVPGAAPAPATTDTRRGLPSVSVPVLSTTSVSTRCSSSSASAFLNSTPAARALPDRHHDRHRRRQPQRARAGDDQHGDRVDQRVRQARRRARPAPRPRR